MTERRAFTMHPNLLWDVITRQAGTLGKAVLEAVMNSIDAGATECAVELSPSRLVVSDDGRGFRDESEIVRFFETFGHPHEEGDATYGRFRMGRGQIFSFGANLWASNEFRMRVDLKPQRVAPRDAGAIGYDYESGKDPVPGCRIEVSLYETLLPAALDAAVREIKDHVAWAQIPIVLNGNRLNKLPSEGKWTFETEDARVLLNDAATLNVYNLGVLVCRLPAHRHGAGGIVVSKTALEVNFARNDIQSSCPVWKRVSRQVSAAAGKAAARKPKLTDAERRNLALRLRTGELSIEEAVGMRLITDVTGSHHGAEKLGTFGRSYRNALSVAKTGQLVAERAHDSKLAFVLSTETLDRFDVETAEEFLALFRDLSEKESSGAARQLSWGLVHAKVVPIEEFAKTISDRHMTIPDSELNPAEKFALSILRDGSDELRRRLGRLRYAETGNTAFPKRRELRVGVSDVADAWTNGSDLLWIHRRHLPLVKRGYVGLIRLAGMLLHEWLHDDSDIESHLHDVDFYARFHDLVIDGELLGGTADAMLSKAVATLRKDGRKPTGPMAVHENRLAEFDALADVRKDAAPDTEEEL
jgi:hypothetical protein